MPSASTEIVDDEFEHVSVLSDDTEVDELDSDSGHDDGEVGRDVKTLFKGICFFVEGQFQGHTRSKVVQLIEDHGGKVTKKVHIGEPSHIIISGHLWHKEATRTRSQLITNIKKANEETRRSNAEPGVEPDSSDDEERTWMLSLDWVLESISKNALEPEADYDFEKVEKAQKKAGNRRSNIALPTAEKATAPTVKALSGAQSRHKPITQVLNRAKATLSRASGTGQLTLKEVLKRNAIKGQQINKDGAVGDQTGEKDEKENQAAQAGDEQNKSTTLSATMYDDAFYDEMDEIIKSNRVFCEQSQKDLTEMKEVLQNFKAEMSAATPVTDSDELEIEEVPMVVDDD
ncbi:hypothetical protein ACM66B_000709 [Microbotryomycetes sp. NB124-2]